MKTNAKLPLVLLNRKVVKPALKGVRITLSNVPRGAKVTVRVK